MVIPGAIKIVIGLAILFCALFYFLGFIGGGAGGSKSMATIGLLLGGAGMIACAYGLFLLTRPTLTLWQGAVLLVACVPVIGIIASRMLAK